MKKSIFVISVLIVCIFSAIFAFISKESKKQQVTMNNILSLIFTCPNDDTEIMIDDLSGSTIIGEGVPNKVDNSHNSLYKTFGRYFTEEAYEDFCNKRYPFEIFLTAQSRSCKTKITNIKISKKDSPASYECSVYLLLTENEKERNLTQKVYITFNEGKITYFYFDQAPILKAINEL
jgi:hypothetical protein